MKRTIILGCLVILFLAGLVSTTIFVVLYLNSQNEIKLKDVQIAACQNAENKEQNICPEIPEEEDLAFTDIGQNIEVLYPSSWVGVLNTEISDDFAYEPIYGRVISVYEYTLTKASTNIKFEKVLPAVDGFPSGLTSEEYNWVEISGTNVLRFASIGSNTWKYVSKIDCESLGEPFFTEEEVANFDMCIGSFFPGFGTLGASNVTVQSSSEDLLSEADLIVKSAIN